jgi:hypothetical protein
MISGIPAEAGVTLAAGGFIPADNFIPVAAVITAGEAIMVDPVGWGATGIIAVEAHSGSTPLLMVTVLATTTVPLQFAVQPAITIDGAIGVSTLAVMSIHGATSSASTVLNRPAG